MYIYACTYKHPDGRLSYYVGKHEEPYEKSGWYLGSGKFCSNFRNKYGKEYTKKNVTKKILMHSIPDSKTLCQWEKIFIASYRQIYGSLCKNWADGGEGGLNGEKNCNYNHTMYFFRNVKTGETFKGTRCNFIKKYGLASGSVSDLTLGKINHHKYWVMGDSGFKSVSDIRRIHSDVRKGKNHPQYDHTEHFFHNVKTGETFKGTQFNFAEKYGLKRNGVCSLVLGQRDHHKYWVTGNSEIKSIADIKRIRSELQKGSNHSQYNHTEHSFRNVKTGETFKGTRYNFIKKYGLCDGQVSRLIRGARGHHKYWVMSDSKIKTIGCIKRIKSEALKGKNITNSIQQIHKRASASGDIRVSRSTFNRVLKDPEHPRHKEFIELRDKHTIKEG